MAGHGRRPGLDSLCLRVEAAGGPEVLLSNYRAGDTVTVHVFRRDELRAFRVRLAEAAPECVLVPRS